MSELFINGEDAENFGTQEVRLNLVNQILSTDPTSKSINAITEVAVTIDSSNVVRDLAEFDNSTPEQRGENSLITNGGHSSGILSNTAFFSNPKNFEDAAKKLEAEIAKKSLEVKSEAEDEFEPKKLIKTRDVIPVEFHWLLSDQILNSDNLENSLEQFIERGNKCIEKYTPINSQLVKNNFRYPLSKATPANSEKQDSPTETRISSSDFRLELRPQDIIQVLKGDDHLVANVRYLFEQEIETRAAAAKSSLDLVKSIKEKGGPIEKELELVTKFSQRGAGLLNRFDTQKFSEEVSIEIEKAASKEGVSTAEYLAKNEQLALFQNNLIRLSEQEKVYRDIFDGKSVSKEEPKDALSA